MDLMDRYLQAVRHALFPMSRERSADIVQELAGNLAAQVHDREAEAGRALSETELTALLRAHGHPLTIAARYRDRGRMRRLSLGRELIGVELFAWYEAALAIGVGATVALTVLAALVLAAPVTWRMLLVPLLLQVPAQTIVFVALNLYLRHRLGGDWGPADLPATRDPLRVPRALSLTEIALIVAFLPWWLGWVGLPGATALASPGPAWQALRDLFTYPIAGLLLVNLAVAAMNLSRPRLSRPRLGVRAAADLLLAVCLFTPLFQRADVLTRDWKLVMAGRAGTETAPPVAAIVNVSLSLSLAIAGLVCAVVGLIELVRFTRWGRSARGGLPRLAATLALGLAMVLVTSRAEAQTRATALPPDSEIRAFLRDRVDLQHASVGMVVGIAAPEGRRIITYGRCDQEDARPLDAGTVFEIGSFTKIFTALLLSDMVQRGTVSLDDVLAGYLPPDVTVPERAGRRITLVDLATHTSGLPFAPADLAVTDPAAYAHYGDAQLFRYLATAQLTSDIGTRWGYSNLGYGLLGRALARRASTGYEDLVRARITAPLGMTSTAATLTPGLRARLAVGHDAQLRPTAAWESPAFPGEGELKSSAADLLTLLEAFMGTRPTPLAPAMAAMLRTRRPGPGFEQALGWWVFRTDASDSGFALFGGQTWGYHSVVAFDPQTHVGVVVLSNGSEDDGSLAAHLMRPQIPLVTSAVLSARAARTEVVVDTALLDTYVGRYRPAEGGPLTITREGGTLVFTSATAPQGLRLRAESQRSFFFRDADLRVTFDVDAAGRVTGLTVRFAGTDYPAPRMEDPARH
jgi:D-alanyl-D-alanine-carboxypeptidase/D-alanyl-D-alanine-endopeptidase